MTDDYDVYDEDEELHDTIRAYAEGKLNYFDYVQTLMMLGKAESDVKEELERVRAEIAAEKAKDKRPEPPAEAEGDIELSSEEDPDDQEPDEGIELSSEEENTDPEPVKRVCAGCGAEIDPDSDGGTIEVNGKPCCTACAEKILGVEGPFFVAAEEEDGSEDAEPDEKDADDAAEEDSEDYTADQDDYEDDKEDYAAELTADGHMGIRTEHKDDEEPEIETEDYGMGVDPEEIEEITALEESEGDAEDDSEAEDAEEPAEDGDPAPGTAPEDDSEEETPSESDPASETEDEPPADPDATERFIESIEEDDSESGDGGDPKPKPKPIAAFGSVIARLPKKPVRRRTSKPSADDPDADPGEKSKKKAKDIDPESLRGKFDRWYKINFQNYVKLRTLSRNADTGEFRMDLDLIKRKDLPRMAVAVTGEKHTYALDKIRRTEWYYMHHDKSMVPPWEAQFTASDAALWMMSDKIDNALSINWTQQNSTLADNKKVILLAGLGILAIVLFFMLRHRYHEILQGT